MKETKEKIALYNAKVEAIKNLKIFVRGTQLVAPYILTAGLIAGGFTLVDATPFHRDEVKEYLSTMTEIDNRGNYRTEEQYGDFENDINILYYYSKWQKNTDGFYERNVQEYTIKNLEYKEIVNLLENNDIAPENMVDNKNLDIVERKSTLNEEDKYEKPYIKIMIYDKSTDEFIVREQTVLENLKDSIWYLALTMLFEGFVLAARMDSSFCFTTSCKQYIEEAKKKKKVK